MVLFAAALTMPDGMDQQHDNSAGSSIYSPVIVSSLTGENVPSSWVLNAAIISRNKRQNKARGVDRNEKAQTATQTQRTTDIRKLL